LRQIGLSELVDWEAEAALHATIRALPEAALWQLSICNCR
jgi:hypothetical protein